jgi:hypothetical protein
MPRRRWLGSSNRAVSVGARCCTTRSKKAHGTVFRELLYHWHPWFGMRVAIHGAVDKADGVVFCCTLSGSGADRWLEVPAWMFDRARCLDSPRLTASPFVSMDALSALQALKLPLSSSNAGILAHPDPLTTRIGERLMTMRSPVQPPAMPAERRRLQQSDRSQQIDLFDGVTPTQTPAWRDLPQETRDTLTGLMARLILEHAQISSPALRTGAGHDH